MDLLQFAQNRKPPGLEDAGRRRSEDTGHESRGWSPLESADSRYLYYIKLPQYSLWGLPLAGGEESQVLPAVAAFGSAFAPAKEGIYFIRNSAHRVGQEIAFFRFATSQITSVVNIPRPAEVGLAVSPDERLILYSQTDQDGSDLMLVENFH
jgi:hypothetical protein